MIQFSLYISKDELTFEYDSIYKEYLFLYSNVEIGGRNEKVYYFYCGNNSIRNYIFV
jgi:hypothetical protein